GRSAMSTPPGGPCPASTGSRSAPRRRSWRSWCRVCVRTPLAGRRPLCYGPAESATPRPAEGGRHTDELRPEDHTPLPVPDRVTPFYRLYREPRARKEDLTREAEAVSAECPALVPDPVALVALARSRLDARQRFEAALGLDERPELWEELRAAALAGG